MPPTEQVWQRAIEEIGRAQGIGIVGHVRPDGDTLGSMVALALAARAHAFIQQHAGVFPDDVQAVFPGVAGHRLKPASNSVYRHPAELCRHVLDNVAIP